MAIKFRCSPLGLLLEAGRKPPRRGKDGNWQRGRTVPAKRDSSRAKRKGGKGCVAVSEKSIMIRGGAWFYEGTFFSTENTASERQSRAWRLTCLLIRKGVVGGGLLSEKKDTLVVTYRPKSIVNVSDLVA